MAKGNKHTELYLINSITYVLGKIFIELYYIAAGVEKWVENSWTRTNYTECVKYVNNSTLEYLREIA